MAPEPCDAHKPLCNGPKLSIDSSGDRVVILFCTKIMGTVKQFNTHYTFQFYNLAC